MIEGICHPYNFSAENLKGRFGRILNGVPYAFHPLLNQPETLPSKDKWQRDWQNDEFLEAIFLESETAMACVHSTPVFGAYHDGLISVEKGGEIQETLSGSHDPGTRAPTSSKVSRRWSHRKTRQGSLRALCSRQ